MARKPKSDGMAETSGLPLFPGVAPKASVCGAEGHRSRMRARLLRAGPESLADYEMLEMVLFLALPRRDTKPLARALLARFGTYDAVLAASVHELLDVEGLGEAGAAALKIVQAAALRLLQGAVKDQPLFERWEQLIAYLMAALAREREEQFRVLFMDIRSRLIADEILGRGTLNHAPVYPREIVRRALELRAMSIILVHNHPSGVPTPSQQDIATTRSIGNAVATIEVRLQDHIIIAGTSWLSFRQEGLLS